MANSDKNIVITPNIGAAADPSIVFSGADATTGPQNITLQVYPTDNGTLSFEGSAGQLFSITNNLSGTIFSVNDVSGIPSFEVNADGTVKIAQYSGRVLFGTGVDNGLDRIQVVGDVSATTFKGPLTGNATTATTLETTRAINGTNFNGSAAITTANWGTARTLTVGSTGKSVNGSANVAWTLAEIGAPSTTGSGASGTWGINVTGNAATATALQTARTIGGVSFNGTANINLPGVNTTGNQSTSGNAATATTLQTTRAINGTNFNGSAAITTANWGTARTLTIGSTGKSVNGSANVAWSLAEIGALPLAGGTLSGTLILSTATGTDATGDAGALTLRGGNSSSNGVGGNLLMNGGDTVSTAAGKNGGRVDIRGGNNTSASGGSGAFLELNGGVAVLGNGGQARLYSGDSKGTNIVGSDLMLFAGRGTGTGVGGIMRFYTSSPTTSGTGLQSHTSRLEINNLGQVSAKANIASSSTTTGTLVVTGGVGVSGTVYAVGFNGGLTGNATTATSLQTTRAINGTNFNGSAAITTTNWGTARTINGTSINGSTNYTTANWGTARTVTIGSTGKSVNGSANVAWTLAEIGANNASNLTTGTLPDARLTGTYSGITLQTNGGNTHFTTPNTGSPSVNDRTVFGLAQFKSDVSATVGAIVFNAPNTTSSIMHRLRIEGMIYAGGPTVLTVIQGYRTTGAWSNLSKINLGITDVQVRFGVTPGGNNCIILGDVGTTWSYPMLAITHAMFSHSGSTDAYCKDWSVGLVTSLTGYTNVTANLTTTAINSSVTGNAATATTLQTTRAINGTNFNGSAAITTANWGTARTITIGGTGKSVNGSANYTWATSEIAAQTAVTLATARAINGTNFNGSAAITTANWGTARTINGTSINGSTNYTTANWGTARTVTIGSTGKSVNGSANVAWSLAEIGAQAALGFTPVQQGGGTGQSTNKIYIGWSASDLLLQIDSTNFSNTWPINITKNAATATALQTARTINGVSFNGTANITVADATKLPLAGGSITGLLSVSNSANTTGSTTKGINFNGVSGTYVFGTTGDGASSTLANLKLSSWWGIGFAPSISGQAVPQWQNAAWIDVRSGAIFARNDITAYASDERLKTNFVAIQNPLEKLKSIGGYEFDWLMDKCRTLGFQPNNVREHGVKAQEIQRVVPDAVTIAPFDNDGDNKSKSGEEYLTVKYEKLVPLLIEAIKEQQQQIDKLENLVEQISSNK